MTGVKGGRRRYNSSSRRAQARRNQEAILDAAQRQFLDAGYGPTTIAAVAAEADVSVETIYKAFGGKSGVVRAIYDRALRGQGPVSAYERSDGMRAREADPRTIMRTWGELTTEVAARMAPIRLLIRAAAVADPEIAAVLKDGDDERLRRMRHHAEFLAERGYLRDAVTTAKATDILYTCSSLEIYDVLVLQRGWPLPEFARFVSDFMIDALLAHAGER
ncbi:MAG TPA: helix-turn-helix domain-containing protein [Egibacteraceae bacterium]|jgi:AcrR family transcriptional regulator|nr:helix-turn-helix domain-containing protein [Egibacteraceae bacterium]